MNTYVIFVDVKTKTFHFYVQRFTDFNATGEGTVPFEKTQLHEGNCMDLASGCLRHRWLEFMIFNSLE